MCAILTAWALRLGGQMARTWWAGAAFYTAVAGCSQSGLVVSAGPV